MLASFTINFSSGIHRLMMSIWGPESKVNKIDWTGDAAKGFAGLGLIAFGLVIALVFQKKIGWLFAIGGGVLLLFIFKIMPS